MIYIVNAVDGAVSHGIQRMTDDFADAAEADMVMKEGLDSCFIGAVEYDRHVDACLECLNGIAQCGTESDRKSVV